MAGASADGEVNHWPAFVDVLTTVIMVVTFLLVVMAAAVMSLSQKAMQQFKERIIAEQQQKHDKDADPSVNGSSASAPGAHNNRIVSPDAEAGTTVAELGSILRSDEKVDGNEKLTIRTRATEDSLKLKVKALEDPAGTKGVEVTTADVLMRVDFEPLAVNYDADNNGKVMGFLKSRMKPGMKYEIWSFAPQASSVTEAQRLAFYRAAMTRNILIKAGIVPSDILTQIRVTDASDKDGHNVRVVLKP